MRTHPARLRSRAGTHQRDCFSLCNRSDHARSQAIELCQILKLDPRSDCRDEKQALTGLETCSIRFGEGGCWRCE